MAVFEQLLFFSPVVTFYMPEDAVPSGYCSEYCSKRRYPVPFTDNIFAIPSAKCPSTSIKEPDLITTINTIATVCRSRHKLFYTRSYSSSFPHNRTLFIWVHLCCCMHSILYIHANKFMIFLRCHID